MYYSPLICRGGPVCISSTCNNNIWAYRTIKPFGLFYENAFNYDSTRQHIYIFFTDLSTLFAFFFL